jgi:hypothetical protein
MIQGRGGARLPAKAIQRLWVLGQLIWKEFEGDVACQIHVLRFVHYSHSPAAQLA